VRQHQFSDPDGGGKDCGNDGVNGVVGPARAAVYDRNMAATDVFNPALPAAAGLNEQSIESSEGSASPSQVGPFCNIRKLASSLS
jgi:hypothetical protein